MSRARTSATAPTASGWITWRQYAVIRNNDQVVTTGSTLYPRGLILGYVVDAGLDGTGVAKYAIINPAAELDSLEQVFVITEYVNE